MSNPVHRAEEASLETFLADYAPEDATFALSTGHTVLLGAMGNPDLEARVGIAELVLDDGADASVTLDSGVNALHVLFSAREHDLEREARLVARLIEGGADVNAVAQRQGPPLLVMLDSGMASLDGVGVVIDAIQASTTVDLEVAVQRRGRPRRTLRDAIATAEWRIPELQQRLGVEPAG